ncbi:Nardilysin-like [Glycine soja]
MKTTMSYSGRDKIETLEQFKQVKETAKKLDLDGLVVIGGDDLNTNACLLAENFRFVLAEFYFWCNLCLRTFPFMNMPSDPVVLFMYNQYEYTSGLSGLNFFVETYFADIPVEAYKTLTSLNGVTAYGFDLVRGSNTLDLIKGGFPTGKYLFTGVVDGRNIWANDLAASLTTLQGLEGIVDKGNKKSLVDAMEKGINLLEQILKLYKDYYHGGLMKLVIIGGGEDLFHYLVYGYSICIQEVTSPRVTYRISGFCFCVQSSEYHPVHLQDGLDGDSFENYKSGLMAKLLEKDPPLTYESNKLWNQIVEKRYIFDLSKKEAKELKNISKHDVVEWYKTYLKSSSPKCQQLLIRLWGCNTDLKEVEALPKSVRVITDPTTFKMQSKFLLTLKM